MPTPQPTLAALLTPPAPGAIAVIGLEGPGVHSLLAAVLRRPKSDSPPELLLRRPTLCRVVDSAETIDDAIAIRIAEEPAPRAEIQTHGGVRIVQRVLLLLERFGATIVPGEAFPRHGVGPVEREIDAALIKTTSRRVAEWLLRQREILPPFLRDLYDQPADVVEAFRRRSLAAIRLFAGLRVAIIGPPNAGKSTLANRLIGADRSITSDIPGTTRDWVSETAFIDGWPVTLIDTAGLRETTCEIETEAIRRSREQAARAHLILMVLDAGHGEPIHLTDIQSMGGSKSQMTEATFTAGGTVWRSQAVVDRQGRADARREAAVAEQLIPKIIVLNKCDRLAQVGQRSSLPEDETLPTAACRVSALTGAGIGELELLIKRTLGLNLFETGEPTAITRAQLEAAGCAAPPRAEDG